MRLDEFRSQAQTPAQSFLFAIQPQPSARQGHRHFLLSHLSRCVCGFQASTSGSSRWASKIRGQSQGRMVSHRRRTEVIVAASVAQAPCGSDEERENEGRQSQMRNSPRARVGFCSCVVSASAVIVTLLLLFQSIAACPQPSRGDLVIPFRLRWVGKVIHSRQQSRNPESLMLHHASDAIGECSRQ